MNQKQLVEELIEQTAQKLLAANITPDRDNVCKEIYEVIFLTLSSSTHVWGNDDNNQKNDEENSETASGRMMVILTEELYNSEKINTTLKNEIEVLTACLEDTISQHDKASLDVRDLQKENQQLKEMMHNIKVFVDSHVSETSSSEE